MPKKIEKYAQDDVVFYLHKQRNFIKKIERQVIEVQKKRAKDELDKVMIEEQQKEINQAKIRK